MTNGVQWDDGTTDWDQPGTFWDVSQPVVLNLPVNPNTVYIPFTPSNQTNFVFQLALDGANYVAIVNWNLFGERYYLNLYDTQQNRILTTAIVGSPNTFNISLTGALFNTLLVFRAASGNFEVIPPA